MAIDTLIFFTKAFQALANKQNTRAIEAFNSFCQYGDWIIRDLIKINDK